MANARKRKSVIKWVLLLVLPLIMLIVVALLQVVVRFVLTKSTGDVGAGVDSESSTSLVKLVVNILSLLIGTASVITLLLSPLWIVFLVRDLKGQERNKTTAIVLAIFFGFFSWLYTYEEGSRRFWINFGLCIVTVGYWAPVGWLWAIIDHANKPDEYYTQYNSRILKTVAPTAPAR